MALGQASVLVSGALWFNLWVNVLIHLRSAGSDQKKAVYTFEMLSCLEKKKHNLVLSSSVSEIAVFQPNSRSGYIGTISPNSASLTVTKALSLHLLSAIDLECPSLYGDFSLSPLLNAHLSASLSASVYLCPSHSPSLVLPACILTKCASFLPAWKSFILMWEEVAALPASSLLIQDNVRQWRSNGILLESL